MTIPENIHTWKQLDEAMRATGNRMFYVNSHDGSGALLMDNGRFITDNLPEAIAHIRES